MPGLVINYQAADYLHDLVMAPLGQPKGGEPRAVGWHFYFWWMKTSDN